MGNKLTKVEATPTSLPLVTPPPLVPAVPLEPVISPEAATKPDVKLLDSNPGSAEELHKPFSDIMPNVFEGAKISINKGLSHNFQVSHSLSINSSPQNGYRFGVTYVGENKLGIADAVPVLVGDTDPMGNVNGQIIHQIGPVRGRLLAQIRQSSCEYFQSTLEFFGRNFTTSLLVANPDFVNNSGMFGFFHLHKINKNLTVGAEIMAQFACRNAFSSKGVIVRYATENWAACAQLSPITTHMTYYHRASSQVQVGVEFLRDVRSQITQSTFAMQFDFPKDNFTFRTSINSNWVVAAVCEKRLPPLPYTFMISTQLHHVPEPHIKNNVSVGVGIILGG